MWTIDGLTYSRRKAIAISHANVTSALNNFALCLQISGDTDIGAVCRSDGADLRFTTQSGTLLYAEKESFAVSSARPAGCFGWACRRSPTPPTRPSIATMATPGRLPRAIRNFCTTSASRPSGTWASRPRRLPTAPPTPTAAPPPPARPRKRRAFWPRRALSRRQRPIYFGARLDEPGDQRRGEPIHRFRLDQPGQHPLTHSYDILCKGWDTTSYELRVAPSGYGVVGFMDASQNEHQLTTGGIVFPSTGTWYHVAGVFDGSYLRFYVNGTQQASLAVSTNPGTDSEALTIGSLAGQSAFCFDGLLDEVRVTNYAHPALDEVRVLQPKRQFRPVDVGPRAAPGGRRLIDGSLASGTQLTAILAE